MDASVKQTETERKQQTNKQKIHKCYSYLLIEKPINLFSFLSKNRWIFVFLPLRCWFRLKVFYSAVSEEKEEMTTNRSAINWIFRSSFIEVFGMTNDNRNRSEWVRVNCSYECAHHMYVYCMLNGDGTRDISHSPNQTPIKWLIDLLTPELLDRHNFQFLLFQPTTIRI